MGIINKDPFLNRYGQELTNTYISLGNNPIELRKEIEIDNNKNTIEIYILTAIFNIWLSKESRYNNSSFSSYVVHKTLSGDEITSNLYTILYTELKKKYTNTTDDL